MNRRHSHPALLGVVSCALVLAIVAVPRPAQAEFVGSLIQIQASNGEETGTWTLNVPVTGDPLNWQLEGSLNIYSDQNPEFLIATVDSLTLQLDGDPQVVVNFAVTAGGVNTVFSISSALVAFGSLTNPASFATAAVTATDNTSDGATVTGLFAGSKAYEATYNGGTVFADLVSPVVAPVDDSSTGTERNPVAGTVPIPGSVTSIAAGFNFVLTAGDSASGTSRFNVVPEPSSIVLALFGAAALAWGLIRRRK